MAVQIALSPAAGPPTTAVRVAGRGFGPSEPVGVAFDRTLLGTAITTSSGEFRTEVRVPASATPGPHAVRARGRDSGAVARATFTVRTDWPDFQFDLANTGHNPHENVLTPGNAAGLEEAWSTDLGDVMGISHSPVASGGVLYAATFALVGRVFALRPEDGSTIWTAEVASNLTTPAVAGGMLYVGSNEGIHALDRATGALVWTHETGAGVFSPPTVAEGVVYVGSNDNLLRALDADTGALVWSAPAQGSIDSSPAVVEGLVYVATEFTGTVRAYDAATGELRWRRRLESGFIDSSPVVAGGLCYIATGGGYLYALDADDGTPRWRATGVGDIGPSTPAVAYGTVYLGSPNQAVYAFDAATGAQRWATPVGGEVGSNVVAANGVIYFGATDNRLYAVDAETGGILGSWPTGGYVSSPIVVDATVYVGSFDEHLYAFRLPHGA